jgi:hypothetical protein
MYCCHRVSTQLRLNIYIISFLCNDYRPFTYPRRFNPNHAAHSLHPLQWHRQNLGDQVDSVRFMTSAKRRHALSWLQWLAKGYLVLDVYLFMTSACGRAVITSKYHQKLWPSKRGWNQPTRHAYNYGSRIVWELQDSNHCQVIGKTERLYFVICLIVCDEFRGSALKYATTFCCSLFMTILTFHSTLYSCAVAKSIVE